MSEQVNATTARMVDARHLGAALAWVVIVVAYVSVAGTYLSSVAASVGILALLGLGMILVTGYAGQFSLAVGAFYGIGAYGSTLLTVKLGWIGLLALVLSAGIAGVVGILLARPLFRLHGHFLAMATLALGQVFYLLVNNAGFTGGSSGLGGIQPFNLGGYSFASSQSQALLNWLVVGMVLWGTLMLRKGREGRGLIAIRGHEAAAAAAGINVATSKAKIFAGSAVISSIAGSFYAHQILYVNPPPFGLDQAILVLMIAVLGGMRSPWGAVVGAIALQLLQQLSEAYLPTLLGSAGVGAGEQLLVGMILVLILVTRPDGVAGALASGFHLVRRRAGQDIDPSRNVSVPTSQDTDMAALRQAESAQPPKKVGDVVLQAAALTKRFGGVIAVHDVALEVRSGEVLAVIGPNGAGKSTLVNLLSGNLPPTAGTVQVGGRDVTRLKAFQIARHGLSRTFQSPCLFEGMDALETVKVGAHLQGKVGLLRSALPTPGAVSEDFRLTSLAMDVMDQLGLADVAAYEATSLSLGQQKRLEVARALVGQPKVILLDEPCAGLNKAEKWELMKTLRQLSREGLAVLVIEHDMEFVMSVADRVQVLNFGETLRIGVPEDVQNDPKVIDAYLGVPHDDHDDDNLTIEGAR